eukprot:scaffold1936_cov21-Tisochrysis_lutea.AAC.2
MAYAYGIGQPYSHVMSRAEALWDFLGGLDAHEREFHNLPLLVYYCIDTKQANQLQPGWRSHSAI